MTKTRSDQPASGTTQPPVHGGRGGHGNQSGHGGMLLGLIGVVIFGLTLPMTRLAVAEFDPVFVGLGRALLAAFAAGLILLAMRRGVPPRSDWPALVITAAGVVIGFPLFATLAMVHASAAHGGVVIAVLPLATAIAAVVFAGERPSRAFWLSAVAGSTAVLVFAWLEGAVNADFGYASLLLVAAIVCAAIGYAQGGSLSRHLAGWEVICWALVISVPVLLPVVWIFAGPVNWSASTSAWTGFLYVALLSQLLGFFAWNAGLARGGVARVGQLQLLQTFVTLAGAALILGEPVTWRHLAFAVIVMACVAVARKTRVHSAIAAKSK